MVTGGAGFIGSHLTDELIARGHDVRVIDNLFTGKREFVHPRAEFHELDVRDVDSITPLFEGMDGVFHLAAQARIQPSILNPVESNSNNVGGTLNVLVAARDAKVKKVVYSASSSAYGSTTELPLREDMPARTLNPYALQKHIGELYMKLFSDLYELPTVSLRYFNVYGPRQPVDGAYATVVGIFLKQKNEGKPLTIVGDGGQTRDFTYVSDIVAANISAFESGRVGKGEVINIGSGTRHTIRNVAALVSGDTAFIPPRPGEARDTLADITKAWEFLGWQPTVFFEEGIEKLKRL